MSNYSLFSLSLNSNVREIQRINERELDLAVEGAASWHDDYRGEYFELNRHVQAY